MPGKSLMSTCTCTVQIVQSIILCLSLIGYQSIIKEAIDYYNLIFTCCIVSSSCGIILFGIFEVIFGQFITRVICNSLTTLGNISSLLKLLTFVLGLALLCFYRLSGYYIMAGWTIMATPAIYYITSNCCMG